MKKKTVAKKSNNKKVSVSKASKPSGVKTVKKSSPVKKAAAKAAAKKGPAVSKSPKNKAQKIAPKKAKVIAKKTVQSKKKSPTSAREKNDAKNVSQKNMKKISEPKQSAKTSPAKTTKKDEKSSKTKTNPQPKKVAEKKPASEKFEASKTQEKKVESKKSEFDGIDISEIIKAVPKKSERKSDSRASVRVAEKTPKSATKKASHVRHSLSIYFSMADLDAYLERRKNVASSVSESRSVENLKSQTLGGVKKPVAKEKKTGNVVGVASIEDLLGFNLFEQPSRQKVEEKDIPKKWKKFYTILMDMRKRYSTGASSRADEVLKRSAKEDSGDLSSYGQHLADAGSESFERDMAYNLLSTEKEMISEIDAAIQRMKDGVYGICELTGQPIPEKRLLAVPFTRYTVEGQAMKDKENATRRKTPSGIPTAFGDMSESSPSEPEEA